MASQTSIVAKQVRLMEWAEQIRDCQNRPKEMDVAAWCAQHGITKANYYYRLKRIRNAGGLSAEIFPDMSPEMPRCLVEAFGHAE